MIRLKISLSSLSLVLLNEIFWQDSESENVQESSPDKSSPHAALSEIEELKSNLEPQLERILKRKDTANPREGGSDSKR